MDIRIEEYTAKARAPWSDASLVSRRISKPAPLALHEKFHTVRGATSAKWNNPMFTKMERDLFQDSPPAMSYELPDVTVFGHGFVIASHEGVVRQSRYLATNIETRISNSLRDPILTLDTWYPWIIASNASQTNYWHRVAQVLPAIMQSREFLLDSGCSTYGLLTHQLTKWQRESLEMLDVGAIDVVEIGTFQSARVSAAIYSDLLSTGNPFTPSVHRAMVRDRLLSKTNENIESGKKICVSRMDSSKRRIINEQDLHNALIDNGFDIITPGSLTVHDQVRLFHSAEIVVAPHGAGSANMLFCRPGARVLEIGKGSRANAGPASLCKTSGAQLWIDFFPDDGTIDSPGGWHVDIDVILDTLSRMSGD